MSVSEKLQKLLQMGRVLKLLVLIYSVQCRHLLADEKLHVNDEERFSRALQSGVSYSSARMTQCIILDAT